ncbi:MAG: NAD(P)/FAD-dependent oxidoreductase [bacterium]|nr:NAD(P)/FAD-dependent oxidoreductase [bacterium]
MLEENSYDIVIVGAGLAGCSAALTAAETGASVLIIEKENAVGRPVKCAEFIPKMMLREIDLEEKGVVNSVDTLVSILPSGTQRSSSSPGYIIDKDTYTRNIALKAIQAGARLKIGTTAVRKEAYGLTVRKAGKDTFIQAKIIIGADGPLSTVGKWIQCENREKLTAIQYTYANPNPGSKGMEVFFHPKYRCGYGWFFPKKNVVNVGVGVDTQSGGNVREAIDFLRENLIRARRIEADSEISFASGLIPTGGILPVIRQGNILLAGDAAGLTDPITGGGNYQAVVSGKYAGETAAHSVLNNDPARLDNYRKKVMYLFGRVTEQAAMKRRFMEDNWERMDLEELIPKTWVGFREYYSD